MNGANLASLPIVDSAHHIAITLDPPGSTGAPEIVWVTAHTANATSATILRAQEGTSARQMAMGTSWLNSPTKLDFTLPYLGVTGVNDRVWNRPGTVSTLDDEFNDASLDPAWVRYDTTAAGSTPVVYTEGADCLSINHAGSSSDNVGPAHALLKPLGGLTYPVTIEACFRTMRRYATNYHMFGLIFTDGVAQTSKACWINPYASTNTGTAFTLRTGGWNALNAGEISTSPNTTYEFPGAPMYQRLKWSAANTFQTDYSPDGVSWMRLPAADYTGVTITPTYIGIAVSSWTINTPSITSVEYLRVS